MHPYSPLPGPLPQQAAERQGLPRLGCSRGPGTHSRVHPPRPPAGGRSVSNTLSQSFEMYFNWLVSSITNPCLISRVLLLPSIGGFHTWDRCNKGAQSGRSLQGLPWWSHGLDPTLPRQGAFPPVHPLSFFGVILVALLLLDAQYPPFSPCPPLSGSGSSQHLHLCSSCHRHSE